MADSTLSTVRERIARLRSSAQRLQDAVDPVQAETSVAGDSGLEAAGQAVAAKSASSSNSAEQAKEVSQLSQPISEAEQERTNSTIAAVKSRLANLSLSAQSLAERAASPPGSLGPSPMSVSSERQLLSPSETNEADQSVEPSETDAIIKSEEEIPIESEEDGAADASSDSRIIPDSNAVSDSQEPVSKDPQESVVDLTKANPTLPDHQHMSQSSVDESQSATGAHEEHNTPTVTKEQHLSSGELPTRKNRALSMVLEEDGENNDSNESSARGADDAQNDVISQSTIHAEEQKPSSPQSSTQSESPVDEQPSTNSGEGEERVQSPVYIMPDDVSTALLKSLEGKVKFLPGGMIDIDNSESEMRRNAVDDLADIIEFEGSALALSAGMVSLPLVSMAALVLDSLQEERSAFAHLANQGGPPSESSVQAVVDSIHAKIHLVEKLAPLLPADLEDHGQVMCGAATALSWVAIHDHPGEHVAAALNAVPVYGERVKQQGGLHEQFVECVLHLLRRLMRHVRRFHMTDVDWECGTDKGSLKANKRHSMKQRRKSTVDENKLFQTGLNFERRFWEAISTDLAKFLQAAELLGEEIEEQAKHVAAAFVAEKKLMKCASACKAPLQEDWPLVLQDMQASISLAESLVDRDSEMYDHLAFVAGGLGVLQWINVSMNPSGFLKEVMSGLMVFGDRVLSQRSEEPELHIAFVDSFKALLQSLSRHVSHVHPRGLVWNASGSDVLEYMASLEADDEGKSE